MIDVSIVADEISARLIELECKRLGLKCAVSDTPKPDAKLYICELSKVKAEGLPKDKTIAICEQKPTDFPQVIEPQFLLSDLRKMLVQMLTNTPSPKNETPKRQKKAVTVLLSESGKSVKVRGNEISLSATEFKVLELLLSRRGKPVTHGEINSLINGKDTNKVNVYICHLRKKLEAGGDKIIHSVRGKCFMIK